MMPSILRTNICSIPERPCVPACISVDAALALRVGLDDACIRGKSFSFNQSLSHASSQDRFELLAKCIAVKKAAMTILGESGMIRHLVVQAEMAEPTIGLIQMDFFAEATFRTNPVAVSDDEHADHQFGIDRWSPHVTIRKPDERGMPLNRDSGLPRAVRAYAAQTLPN
jgi:hypothetical protein